MMTQRTFEPHEFEAYAEAGNICRHCDRGKYALHHHGQFPQILQRLVGSDSNIEHDTPAAPERIWLCRNPESLRFGVRAVWQPDREEKSDIEYVRADLLATKVKEEREAAFNDFTAIVKQYIGACPGDAQLQLYAALKTATERD